MGLWGGGVRTRASVALTAHVILVSGTGESTTAFTRNCIVADACGGGGGGGSGGGALMDGRFWVPMTYATIGVFIATILITARASITLTRTRTLPLTIAVAGAAAAAAALLVPEAFTAHTVLRLRADEPAALHTHHYTVITAASNATLVIAGAATASVTTTVNCTE